MKKSLIALCTLLSFNTFAEMKVMTINMGVLAPGTSDNARINQLCEILKQKKDLELVFVQEVWMKSVQDKLKECSFPHSLTMNEQTGIESRRQNKELKTTLVKSLATALSVLPDDIGFDKGLMILSKFPLSNPQNITFTENGSEEYFQDGEIAVAKGAIGATMKHPRYGDIFVATTHLVADYDDHEYGAQRADQSRELKEWLQEVTTNSKRTIIGGDFNSSRYLNGNYIDFMFLPKGSGSLQYLEGQSTFSGKTNLTVRAESGADYTEGVIDHIIGYKGMQVKDAKILVDQFYSTEDDEAKILDLSDHHAVEATLGLQ